MGNPETSSSIEGRGEFNSELVEDLRQIESEANKTKASPESLSDGDSFLERSVDASVEGIKKYIEDFDGNFEDIDDKAIFIAGRIGTYLMKLIASRAAPVLFSHIKGEDIGYNLILAKTALEQGEWDLLI